MADAGRCINRRGGNVQAHPAGQPQVVLSGKHQGRGILYGTTGQARQLRDRRVRSSERSRERGEGRLRKQESPDTLHHREWQAGRLLRSRTGREEGICIRRRRRRVEHEIGHRLRTHEELDCHGDTGRFAQCHFFSVSSFVTVHLGFYFFSQNNKCKNTLSVSENSFKEIFDLLNAHCKKRG